MGLEVEAEPEVPEGHHSTETINKVTMLPTLSTLRYDKVFEVCFKNILLATYRPEKNFLHPKKNIFIHAEFQITLENFFRS